MIRYYRYARHEEIHGLQGKGWAIANDLKDCPHGFFAVLMIWEGAGEPD